MAKDSEGKTPMLLACEKDNVDVIKVFLKVGSGVDLYRQDERGRTLLHYAAECNAMLVASLLLKQGGDNQIDNDGKTAYDIACDNDNGVIVMNFLQAKCGININAQDRRGRTKLHYAAENGHRSVAAALVSQGVDVSLAKKGQRTAREIAHQMGHTDIVEIIDLSPTVKNQPIEALGDEGDMGSSAHKRTANPLVKWITSRVRPDPVLSANMKKELDDSNRPEEDKKL